MGVAAAEEPGLSRGLYRLQHCSCRWRRSRRCWERSRWTSGWRNCWCCWSGKAPCWSVERDIQEQGPRADRPQPEGILSAGADARSSPASWARRTIPWRKRRNTGRRSTKLQLSEENRREATRESATNFPKCPLAHMRPPWCAIIWTPAWSSPGGLSPRTSLESGPRARKILDRDHYGMEKVKERILEILAVRSPGDRIQGTGDLSGGTSRRGEDLHRPVHRGGHGAEICPGIPGRRAG